MHALMSRLASRRMVALLVGLLAVIVIVAGIVTREPAPLPVAVHPLLPDLTMGQIMEVQPGLQEGTGDPVVRVEATIVDIGAGPFVVSARRDYPWSSDWTVYQRIAEAGGGYTERKTPADLVFAGAPHSHWHVKNMETHQLERLDTGEVLSQVIKQGFCPYDTDKYFGGLSGAPTDPIYMEAGCEGAFWTTSLHMGVSVGWGDKYPWHMVEQAIDVKGIPDGKYRIREIADPYNWFEESNETNNETWIEIELTNTSGIPRVTVLDRAPAVVPSAP